ncbi:MAG: ribonuclease H-like domain-containing protein [Eubacteriales bacterium]|jgi:uncharacterized protein YprB with RNaseH-like and TPR domain
MMILHRESVNDATAAVLDEWTAGRTAIFFDIETTGLARRGTQLYLIGALAREKGEWTLRQWLLDDPREEKVLLRTFSDYLKDRTGSADSSPVILHYNGDTFDIPYIRTKCRIYSLPDPFDGMESIDIYRRIHPYRHLLGADKLRQKDLEQFLGVAREDCMDGGELISVYKKYLETQDPELQKILFLHNHDDVAGMAQIVPVLSLPEAFENEPSIVSCELSDPDLVMRMQLSHPMPEKIAGSVFPLQTVAAGKKKNGRSPVFPVRLELEEDASERQFLKLCIPVYSGQLYHFFKDYRNYYYLPDEDQAIHKDIAVYVSPEHREKAKAENCYQKRQGHFCPEPEEIIQPVFLQSYQSWPPYFEITGDVLQNKDLMGSYAHTVLSHIRLVPETDK